MEQSDLLNVWFFERLKLMRCSDVAKAYLCGVLCKYKQTSIDDMSKSSIVLAYHRATMTHDFEEFQRIGDWVLWADSIVPMHIDRNRQLIHTCARLSYYKCNSILNGEWRVYEELADNLPKIIDDIRHNLSLL